MYHELGHAIIDRENDPKVEPFRRALGKFNNIVSKHFREEIEQEKRKVGPRMLVDSLINWNSSWLEGWSIEVFCDLFGLYTIGPAFAWSHLHLSVKRNENPCRVPYLTVSSHPPDHSRMSALLNGLTLCRFDEMRNVIESKWHEYLALCGYEKMPEIDRALPNVLLQHAAALAYEGTRQIGCRIPDSTTSDYIYELLNRAWTRFWFDSSTFFQWETEKMKELKSQV